MKLTDIEFVRLLPLFMRDDKNAQAFAYAVQSQIVSVSLAIEHAKLYSRIDSLTDAVLDELAWQFNIAEYKNDYDISIKRELVKGCMELHYKRGTRAAVEDAVKKIFGDATIEEWFEYGGNPYHFKIRTTNLQSTDEMLQEITKIVRETQNVRSYLEEVIVEIVQSMNIYVGCTAIIMDDVSLRTVD